MPKIPEQLRPVWKKWRFGLTKLPSKATLWRWRAVAERLALKQGARTACGLCKRPLGVDNGGVQNRGKSDQGRLTLTFPGKKGGPGLHRNLCFGCAATLTTIVAELETTLSRDHLPADVTELSDEEIEKLTKAELMWRVQQHRPIKRHAPRGRQTITAQRKARNLATEALQQMRRIERVDDAS